MGAEIRVAELKRRLDAGEPTLLVDVRQGWEHETARLPDSLLAPLDELAEGVAEMKARLAAQPETLVVAYCHHGIRSMSAAALLARVGVPALSLAGGIDRWSLEIDPSVPRY